VTGSPLLELGYIAAAHGVKGKLIVRTFDPKSTALGQVQRLHLKLKDACERELRILSRRQAASGWVLGCAEIDTRSEAEGLLGGRVSVFREDLEPPREGEFFQGDLIGLIAVNEAGRVLGNVAEVWNTGPVPNLVIRGPDDVELLVPFADEFVPRVDLAEGRVVIRPPELKE
jgi:16S rRNA processing protein RimM